MLGRVARSWWLRLGITAAILVYLGSRLDMAAAGRAILTVSRPHLAVVLLLVGLDRLVMILRWLLLLRASGTPISAKSAAWIFLVSSFVGSFLPAGVGGDAARAWTLTQRTAQGSEALASVAVDRLLGILSLVGMGAAGLLLVAPAGDGDWRLPAAVALLAAICLCAFWADRLVRAIVPAHRHEGAITRRLLRLSDAVSRYRGRGGVLVHVMAWSLVVQLLRIGQAYLLGLGLGITVPFRFYLLFMPVGLLMLLLPVSISGFGLPQGVFVWLLRPLGVPDEASFALSTLIVLTGLAGNLPGLVLWLRARR
ncbi:MAG: lysylphosphatidylglycerol synthase transmembrane domain-containing protein [Vicinamibacterales bacterium]